MRWREVSFVQWPETSKEVGKNIQGEQGFVFRKLWEWFLKNHVLELGI